MRRLGEILLEAGAIGVGELQTGLEACHRTGGRLGTQLLLRGFIDEHTLLEALSEQYGVPPVGGARLENAATAIRRLIPPMVARQLRAVPFDRADGRLMVAMANPRDPAALEEIASHVELDLEPHVATETAINAVLDELEDDVVIERVDEDPDDRRGAASSSSDWERLWRPARLGPRQLAAIAGASPSPTSRPRRVATFPGLAPIEDGGLELSDQAISEATYRRGLQDVGHRDDVGDLLLRFAVGYLDRLCLFMVYRGRIVGWLARGRAVVVDDVQSFETTVDTPSVFATVRSSGDHYLGPLTEGAADRELVRVLGDPAPRDVLVLPVRVKERIVAYLVGDLPGESAITVPVAELASACAAAGMAFEMLILRNKIGG